MQILAELAESEVGHLNDLVVGVEHAFDARVDEHFQVASVCNHIEPLASRERELSTGLLTGFGKSLSVVQS